MLPYVFRLSVMSRIRKPATLSAQFAPKRKTATLDSWLGLQAKATAATNSKARIARRKVEATIDLTKEEPIVILDEATDIETDMHALNIAELSNRPSHKNAMFANEIWMRVMVFLDYDDIKNLKAAWWSVGLIANQVFPNMRFIWPESLFRHQTIAVDWVKSVEHSVPAECGMRGGILALEMGLGKTLIMLTTIFRDVRNTIGPTLVVTHKVLLETWMNEIARFFPTESNRVYILHADTAKKSAVLTHDELKKFKLVLTTFETVSAAYRKHPTVAARHTQKSIDGKVIRSWLPSLAFSNRLSSKGFDLFFDKTWGRLIVDETDKIMNHRGTIFLSLMAIPARYRWCLSGTPIRNKAGDLRNVLAICGANRLPRANRSHVTELVDAYRLFIMRMGYDGAKIRLPSKTVTTEVVPFTNKLHRSFYDLLMSTAKKRLGSCSSGDVQFQSILTLFHLMRVVCISPALIDDKSIVTEVAEQIGDDSAKTQWTYQVGSIGFNNLDDEMREYLASGHSAKFDAALDHIKRLAPDEKCVVFSGFDSSLRLFADRLDKNGIGYERLSGQDTLQARTRKLDNFRSNLNCTVILLTFRLGGKGLQLTNASKMIVLDPWWCPAEHEQAEARCHRIGQLRPVSVTYLVMENSIEMDILRIYCGQKTGWKREFDLCTVEKADTVKLNFEWLKRLFNLSE